MALIDKLTAIGDAIREKTGKTDALTLDQMPTEIAGIETGGSSETIKVSALTDNMIAYLGATNIYSTEVEFPIPSKFITTYLFTLYVCDIYGGEIGSISLTINGSEQAITTILLYPENNTSKNAAIVQLSDVTINAGDVLVFTITKA